MFDALYDAIIDSIKLLPFLFFTFLLMEYLEHKFSEKSEKLIIKSRKYGPILGSILGAFPQCGFSVAATNLYATRIITMGTLIAVYLSTSDEMLPILISTKTDIKFIFFIIILKIIIGMIFGILIDLLLRKNKNNDAKIKDFCEDEHCDCGDGVLKSSLKHTFKIFIFILIITIILNICISQFKESWIENIFIKNNILSPFVASLIGLIPNCASSVIIIQFYLKNIISLGSAVAGLLTSSGIGILVLFRTNKNLKENIFILSSIYFIGAIFGVLFNIVGI